MIDSVGCWGAAMAPILGPDGKRSRFTAGMMLNQSRTMAARSMSESKVSSQTLRCDYEEDGLLTRLTL
jgi:hypothetical protein